MKKFKDFLKRGQKVTEVNGSGMKKFDEYVHYAQTNSWSNSLSPKKSQYGITTTGPDVNIMYSEFEREYDIESKLMRDENLSYYIEVKSDIGIKKWREIPIVITFQTA